MDDQRRALYLCARFVALAIALAVLVAEGPRVAAHLNAGDAVILAIIFVAFVALLRINVPPMSRAYVRRRRLEPGRVTLELPLMLVVVTMYGPVVAAAINVAGYCCALPTEGRSRLLRRLLDGGANAVLWLCLGGIHASLFPGPAQVSVPGYLSFLAFYVVGIYAFLYLIWMPLRALAKRVTLRRLWRSLSRDTRLVSFIVLLTSWGYVCAVVWERAGPALGMACFGPLPFMATALRSLNEHQIELHRLHLARDAIQAMLGAGDPIPQMNSLLASLHTMGANETLQIYAAIAPEETRLSPLSTIGPQPTAEQLDLCRRALTELRTSDRSSLTLRARGFVVIANAVRSPSEELLGALIAYRPAFTAPLLHARRFAQTAGELAPLLRDFRSIAATQTAAAIDALTGLPNRRTILDWMREQVATVGVRQPCAVLLLDIDKFKAINDQLGHPAGDRCLRSVGRIIARNIRSVDRAGRVGGEEFVVLMPEAGMEVAVAVGERLRAAIQTCDLRHADGEPITASIGAALADAGDTVETLMARADRALYEAKRLGRNRVIEAQPS